MSDKLDELVDYAAELEELREFEQTLRFQLDATDR